MARSTQQASGSVSSEAGHLLVWLAGAVRDYLRSLLRVGSANAARFTLAAPVGRVRPLGFFCISFAGICTLYYILWPGDWLSAVYAPLLPQTLAEALAVVPVGMPPLVLAVLAVASLPNLLAARASGMSWRSALNWQLTLLGGPGCLAMLLLLGHWLVVMAIGPEVSMLLGLALAALSLLYSYRYLFRQHRLLARRTKAANRGIAILVLATTALLVYGTVLRNFGNSHLASEGMRPTLRAGDHVVVSRLAYELGGPQRGDLALFADPHGPASRLLAEIYLKRVIALPGETVEIRDGLLFLEERQVARRPAAATGAERGEDLAADALAEPGGRPAEYLEILPNDVAYRVLALPPGAALREVPRQRVPAGHYFVLGDNRAASVDSRLPAFGLVPADRFVGKAVARVWPLGSGLDPAPAR